jgi:hypoxanthine phosphoribosyltransferase
LDTRRNLEGSHVLIVEDIVDRGHSMHYIHEQFNKRNLASLRTCVLIWKKPQTIVPVHLDYIAFELLEDKWVFGYGMDLSAGEYRNLPYVAVYKIPAKSQ